MHSRSYLFLGLVLFLAALSGYLFTVKTPRWGLDIQGGVQLNYRMMSSKGKVLTGTDLESAKERTLTVLEHRVNGIGVSEASVQFKDPDQFIIEIPGYKDVDAAKAIIGSSARILFYDAKNVQTKDAGFRRYKAIPSEDAKDPSVKFSTSDGKIIPPRIPDPTNPKATIPNPEYENIIAGWGDPIIQGDQLSSANMTSQGGIGSYEPEMHFSGSGSQNMQKWSVLNNTNGEELAVVLDGKVISMAPLKDGAVISDEAVTEGTFTPEYVHALVDLLNAGALPVDLKDIGSAKVDATVGQNALNMMFTAGVIASCVIVVFMLVYYEFPGLVAVLALGLYILFTLTVLKLIDATFSLAAIAGVVLSIGMAVDANILVFERLKEEMRLGKDLQRSLNLGFNRALPAIIDSNACTVLTALVLLNFGTGPVKGFATTLIIGVVISLFTAVVVTRSLLQFAVGSGMATNPKWYGLNRQWFGESLEAGAHKKPLQIVNKAGRYFLISALTIVPGVLFFALGGLKGNVEFTGGTEIVFDLPANMTSQSLVANLTKAGLPDCSVVLGSSGNQRLAYITIPPNKLVNETTKDAAATISGYAGITPPQPGAAISHISGTIQNETIKNAIYGVVLSTLLIILYLSFRFGAMGGFRIGGRFAVSAVLALLHDVLVVIGLAAIMGYFLNWQISALFISAMLTVIAFSTHDTIVIFDRIRENLRRPEPGEEVGNLINRSITQSVARSINTSMTVIVTLALLIGVGSATPELKLFNLSMMIGIISGTYSSIFNASPILYLWDVAIGKKHADKTLLAISAQNRVRLRMPVQEAGPATTSPTTPKTPAGYGQVRRRASDIERSRRSIDED